MSYTTRNGELTFTPRPTPEPPALLLADIDNYLDYDDNRK